MTSRLWTAGVLLARMCCAVLMAGAFAALVQSFQYIDWGRGGQKAILLVIIIAAAGLMAIINRSPLPNDFAKSGWIFSLLAVAIFYRLACFFYYQSIPGVSDIAQTTLAAIGAVLKGVNPYAAAIDLNPDYPDYYGYKYLPVTIAAYLPLGAPFGATGMRLTNLVLDMATAVLVGRLAAGRSQPHCGVLAAALYLMLPLAPRDLYMNAVTDLVAVLPLLAGLALCRTRPAIAGAMVGLSVSAKLLPGLLFIVICFPAHGRRRYAGGVLLGLIPAIAFFVLDPSGFVQNIVRFPGMRPGDTTSWLYAAPSYLAALARGIFAVVMAAVAAAVVGRPPDLLQRCALGVLCSILALLAGPVAHNNYMLWWVPLFCVLLAATLSRIKPGSPRPACR